MARQNKKEQKPVKIFALDAETRGLFGDIFRVGIYDGDRYHPSNTFKEIKNILHKYTIDYDCHVFVHNLDFDLSKIIYDVIPGAVFDKSIFINNNVTVFQTSIGVSQSNEESEIISQPITFHDSSKLIMGRLKKICKDFNLDVEQSKIELKDHILSLGWGRDKNNKPIKHESEYHEFNSEGYYFENVDPWEKQLNEYLRMDCVSLHAVVTTLIEISGLEIEDFLRCPTTASLAMKVFTKNYEDDYKKACSTHRHYMTNEGMQHEKFIRDSYCGGRTEVFIPYQEFGYHYDVNSLYPYVMKNFNIPYGKPKMYEGEAAHNTFGYWLNYNAGAGFIELDIFIPDDLFIPPLPIKRHDKLLFPTGNIKGIWTFEEVKKAMDMGCRVKKVHRCLYFDKKAKIFEPFVTHFEHIKNTGDGALKQFAKLMQNSLYGKFGMKRIQDKMMPIEMLAECEQNFEEKGLSFSIYENPLIPGEQFIEAQTISNAEYIQPHIAAYVTSLARLVLYEGLITQLQRGQVSYCDTDSIVCTAPMDDNLIHDKEYGKWKLETELIEGLFIQPKVYWEKHASLQTDENGLYLKTKDGSFVHKETKKFKGIPRQKMDDITEETYREIYERYKLVQKKMEKGEKISDDLAYFALITKDDKVPKRIKFAMNLKYPKYDENGLVTFDESYDLVKGINLTNMQKRQMDYIRNTSKPHKFIDF